MFFHQGWDPSALPLSYTLTQKSILKEVREKLSITYREMLI
jgi:hypothetical protein